MSPLTDIERIAGRELVKGRQYREHRSLAGCETEIGLAILVDKADAALAERDDVMQELAQDRDQARRTSRDLNRRCQAAEAAVAEKIREHPGHSLGRALANAGYGIAVRERDEALAMLRLCIVEDATPPCPTVWDDEFDEFTDRLADLRQCAEASQVDKKHRNAILHGYLLALEDVERTLHEVRQSSDAA